MTSVYYVTSGPAYRSQWVEAPTFIPEIGDDVILKNCGGVYRVIGRTYNLEEEQVTISLAE
jgi:hypothetical protein